jgi:MFS family permease
LAPALDILALAFDLYLVIKSDRYVSSLSAPLRLFGTLFGGTNMESITGMKKKIFYGWWIVAATHFICMIGYSTWIYCFGVFFRPMAGEFDWSSGAVSVAYALRSLVVGIAAPILGWAVDKYGPRAVVFIGGIVAGLGWVMMYFVNSLLDLYLIYGGLMSMGMSAILYVPAMTAVANWFIEKRSRAMSLLAIGAGIGGLWIPPLVTKLLIEYGWRNTSVVIGIAVWAIVLPLSLLLIRKPEDVGLTPDGELPTDGLEAGIDGQSAVDQAESPAPEAAEVDWTLWQALRSRTFWILAFVFFLAALAHSMVTVHAINSLKDAGFPDVKATFYGVSLFVSLSIVGRLGFGSLGDFVDKRYLFMIAYTLCGFGIIALTFAQSAAFALLYSALYGIGFGGTIPLSPAIRGEYFGRTAFGTIQGFMAPVMMMGAMTGATAAGFLYDLRGTYTLSFGVVAMLQFLAAFTIFFARPAQPPGSQPAEAVESA